MESRYTHRVAVIAFILKNDKFLLLKRTTEPKIWAPPGGRLRQDENPEEGLKREIKEETNWDVEIVAPINIWFGDWNGSPLLSIDYLVEVTGGEFRLSPEHSEAVWVSIEDLRSGHPVSLDPRLGFQLRDFENAFRLIKRIRPE
ncbi:MAG: hypothetical protein Kow0042_07540 [Calditrichia bacterium]